MCFHTSLLLKNRRNIKKWADLELVEQYQQRGDTLLVAELLERHSNLIMAFAYKHIKNPDQVKDFTQDLFLKLCKKLKEAQVKNFKSWFFIFMRNSYFDEARRKVLRKNYLDELAIQQTETKAEETKIDKDYLYKVLEKLKEKERTCIRLIYLEEKSYEEVSKDTGWTFNQIRGLRERATKKLKQLMSKEYYRT